MNSQDFPLTLPDNDPPTYFTEEFPLLLKHDVECIFHRNYQNNMHCHDYYEINLITGGDGLHYFDTQRFHVKKGDFFVIPTHVKHGYINLGGLDVIHIIITPKFIDNNCTLFFKNKEYYSLFQFDPLLKMHYAFDFQPNISGENFDELVTYSKNIIRQQNDISDESDRIIKALTTAFLFLAFRCYREQTSNIKIENRYYGMIQNVMQYVYEHYAEKINVTDLAELSGYSRSNFFRFFKKMTAMSPGDFIDLYRVNAAREMLARSEKTLTDVAADCGFFDSSHFIRVFKKFTGMTPKKYRSGE